MLGGRLAGGLEVDTALELELWLETCTGFGAPGTQPGTMSAAVADAGPSVTATQPGRWGLGPTKFSEGTGLCAAHEFITSSGTKRFSFANTGQSSITPELFVHVCTARSSTSRFHPFMKSACSE